MDRYAVCVREILQRTVIVDAHSIGEAIGKVEEALKKEDICLCDRDYFGSEIRPSEDWVDGEVPDDADISYYWHL